jgi:hypothetical protein
MPRMVDSPKLEVATERLDGSTTVTEVPDGGGMAVCRVPTRCGDALVDRRKR